MPEEQKQTASAVQRVHSPLLTGSLTQNKHAANSSTRSVTDEEPRGMKTSCFLLAQMKRTDQRECKINYTAPVDKNLPRCLINMSIRRRCVRSLPPRRLSVMIGVRLLLIHGRKLCYSAKQADNKSFFEWELHLENKPSTVLENNRYRRQKNQWWNNARRSRLFYFRRPSMRSARQLDRF